MTAVPLPLGFNGLDDQPRLRENLINLFNIGTGLIRTPSIDVFANGHGLCRGQGLFQDEAYFCSGDRFIRVNADGTVDDIGAMSGGDTVIMESTANEMVIVARGGDSFIWDGTTLTTTTANPNFVVFRDVAVINQRAFYVPLDGGPVLFSEVNDMGTINAANFIDAQLLPDNNIGNINYRNNMYVMGAQSIEAFRPTGNADLPILRDEAASIFDTGYVAGKTLFADTFGFLGRLRNGSYGFHVMGQGKCPRISNGPIEEILNEKYNLDELTNCVGMRYKWKGHEVMVFSLLNHAFCYSNGNWFFQESGIGGPNPNSSWRGYHLLNAYGVYLIGDKFGNSIGKLVDGTEDYGQKIEREITTFVRMPVDTNFTISTVAWDCLTGTGVDADDKIGISVSSDGMLYGPSLWKGLGDLGDYRKQVRWVVPGGFGTYANFMGIRTRVTAAVDFSADALEVN